MRQKHIFAIIGSAGANSANLQIVKEIVSFLPEGFSLEIFDRLKDLPHFDTELSIDNTPEAVINFRASIEKADGVLICTPEYVFSIPSGLKNAIEWCVSTTVFSDKPVAMITASAHGMKGHEELQLIMNTVGAAFTADSCLLIQGVKGKIADNKISDDKTLQELKRLVLHFTSRI